ncbi:hypothetical protein FACS1894132_00020 [Clostridia bacterium]|nr:hypothetical protein FACS1894132_00020 [Clostridia bacterium]
MINIDEGAFSECQYLEKITIPNRITSISSYMFEDCISLTNIIIPDSITSIGYRAFANCKSLTNIVLPDGVIIGDVVFYYCSSLRSIVIPESVTSIGRDVFAGRGELTIYGVSASYAETYANKEYISFADISEFVEPEPVPTIVYGDIDLDSEIGKIADIVLLGKHVANKITLTGQSLINANCDTRDPAVNVADLQALIKFMLKQLSYLPYEG